MKKFKMLALSLIAALSLGLSVTVSNVQASESVVPLITQASDQIYATRTVPYTHTSAMWVTETRNGKNYSGYVYNRGFADSSGHYSFFAGWLLAGSHADPYLLEDK
ncbi:hypothetical protein [Sporosarcina limicola]|uniref:Uncharacterized protein n=1 Tax=Sporosarcina limicola TaxID=34101 RepID=A0A927RH40_9BACL|nr:hypothetical protein [Sporosarcina limicola]MBE1557102.1 hypothetical protein [Sporosarcina limicola]